MEANTDFVMEYVKMAGNTRGKLKEQFEGVHRNFEWSKKHLEASLILIKDYRPNLSESVKALADGINIFDELAMNIYSHL